MRSLNQLRYVAIICLALALSNGSAIAQVFKGNVKDQKTNKALPFVNVGIVGQSVGTVTDTAGNFTIQLAEHDTDSLRISMIGYYPQSFLVSAIKKDPGQLDIKLKPQTIQLKEVKVTNHTFKEVTLGNTTESTSTDAGFTSNKLGNEIGAIIKIKKSPTFLKRFNASLAHPAPDSVTLRLNIYSVKGGLPDKNLLQQNIFITVKRGQNKISVDLKPFFIEVDDKFFISLEWIENSPGRGLMFSASLFSSAIIARETSQANWEKVGIAGVGFNVLAEY